MSGSRGLTVLGGVIVVLAGILLWYWGVPDADSSPRPAVAPDPIGVNAVPNGASGNGAQGDAAPEAADDAAAEQPNSGEISDALDSLDGGPDSFEQILSALDPNLSVADRRCDAGVCVFSLRLEAGDGKEAAKRALSKASFETAMGVDAQPTARWVEAEDGGEMGYLWMVPNGMSNEEANAHLATAEANVASLGG